LTSAKARALVAWQRIIMPDGKSIQIPRMPATDQAGAAGLKDGVDFLLGTVAIGLGISTVISFLGNLSRHRGDGERTIITDVGDTATQMSARAGSRVADRFLNVRATITIRQGWPVRVLINRDLVLSPYDPRLQPAADPQ
jgi:type IV secretion system protein VirB10